MATVPRRRSAYDHHFKDMTGQRIGRLVVVARDENGDKRNGAKWVCLCDCGNFAVITGGHLRAGTSSCGCMAREWAARGAPAPLALAHRIHSHTKRGAVGRSIPFALTCEDVNTIINEPCFYCGHPGSNTIEIRGVMRTYNGIDRIDNTEGYTLENSTPCCKYCNHAKHTMTQTEYINLCRRVAEKHGGTS